jgi:ABC-2 type transport system ATP-binding protein
MIAIQTDNLTKRYSRDKITVLAVNKLNLQVEVGQVYGFLGPNGAGKTTTIRMLMDLIRPTGGSAQIYGKDVRTPGALKRVGALVEGPAFYGYLDGRTNLEILARTAGTYSAARVHSLLEQVGLASRAGQQVSGYSLGMKQRLGIAAALLDDPKLVILDEPTNGLDPAGIQEMRAFIRALAVEEGKTVFLSSHLLNEVEQICDRVAIIQRGEMIREGPVSTLLEEGKPHIRIQLEPLEVGLNLLTPRFEAQAEPESNGAVRWVSVCAAPAEGPELVSLLAANGVKVFQVIQQRRTLEEFFMEVTQGEESHA